MRAGSYVIYNGKEYRGSLRNGNKVRMISEDIADEEKGFTYIKFLKYYEKIVDIEEVTDLYEVIPMCDYMGETFKPLGIDDDTVVLYSAYSTYLEKGFVQDGRDGYIKEISISDCAVRWVKEDKLLYYRIKNALKERISDDSTINDFSFGILNRRSKHGMKGCFFYDGRYYVYRKKDGHDMIGPLNENGLYLIGEKTDIIGPFSSQDLLYACAKILGEEELFKDHKFSQEAEKVYNENIYHSTEEMEKAAYLIEHKE